MSKILIKLFLITFIFGFSACGPTNKMKTKQTPTETSETKSSEENDILETVATNQEELGLSPEDISQLAVMPTDMPSATSDTKENPNSDLFVGDFEDKTPSVTPAAGANTPATTSQDQPTSSGDMTSSDALQATDALPETPLDTYIGNGNSDSTASTNAPAVLSQEIQTNIGYILSLAQKDFLSRLKDIKLSDESQKIVLKYKVSQRPIEVVLNKKKNTQIFESAQIIQNNNEKIKILAALDRKNINGKQFTFLTLSKQNLKKDFESSNSEAMITLKIQEFQAVAEITSKVTDELLEKILSQNSFLVTKIEAVVAAENSEKETLLLQVKETALNKTKLSAFNTKNQKTIEIVSTLGRSQAELKPDSESSIVAADVDNIRAKKLIVTLQEAAFSDENQTSALALELKREDKEPLKLLFKLYTKNSE